MLGHAKILTTTFAFDQNRELGSLFGGAGAGLGTMVSCDGVLEERVGHVDELGVIVNDLFGEDFVPTVFLGEQAIDALRGGVRFLALLVPFLLIIVELLLVPV